MTTNERVSTMPDRPTFAALLEAAVSQPGTIARAYSAFHSFSLGNQLRAAMQCAERGLPRARWRHSRPGSRRAGT